MVGNLHLVSMMQILESWWEGTQMIVFHDLFHQMLLWKVVHLTEK
jgi:hypothetical protein